MSNSLRTLPPPPTSPSKSTTTKALYQASPSRSPPNSPFNNSITTPGKDISASLLGEEWKSAKSERTAALSALLQQEEDLVNTGTPLITPYNLPDRAKGDVLANLERKEALRLSRLKLLEKRVAEEVWGKEDATFHPAINPKSVALLKEYEGGVSERMKSREEESRIKKMGKEYEYVNFDGKTGQRYGKPVVNKSNDVEITKGWRSAKGAAGDPTGTQSGVDSDGDSDDPSLSSALDGIRVEEALYNDAAERKSRHDNTVESAANTAKQTSNLYAYKSPTRRKHDSKLVQKNLSRKLSEAFDILVGGSGALDQSSDSAGLLTEALVLKWLNTFKEQGLITQRMFKDLPLSDVEDADGVIPDGNRDNLIVSREMAAEVFRGFINETQRRAYHRATSMEYKDISHDGTNNTSEPHGIDLRSFLKVGLPCCEGALSSGDSCYDDFHSKDKEVAAPDGDGGSEKNDETPGTPKAKEPAKDNNWLYPSPHPRSTSPTPATHTPLTTSTLQIPSKFSKPTAYFCRASIRYITLTHAQTQLEREEAELGMLSFKPELCANSLRIDKNVRKLSFFKNSDRVDVMMRSAKNVELKVARKKEALEEKEMEPCSFQPEITKYKFKESIEPPAIKVRYTRKSALKASNGSISDEMSDGEKEDKDGWGKVRVVKFREATSPVNDTAAKENDKEGDPLSVSMLENGENGGAELDYDYYDNPTDSDRGRTVSGQSFNSSIASSKASIHGWTGPIEVQEYLSKAAHERLYERRPHPKKQDANKTVATLEERELAQCTFQPTINRGKRELKERVGVTRRNTWFGFSLNVGAGGTVEERRQKLEDDRRMRGTSSRSPVHDQSVHLNHAVHGGRGRINTVDHDRDGVVPKNFNKAIDKLKAVNKAREDRLKFEENSGYTEESYQKALALRKKGIAAPKFENKDTKKRAVKLYMDVKLKANKTGRIALRDGDRPVVLAKTFAKIHSVGSEMVSKLAVVIEQNMRANNVVVGKLERSAGAGGGSNDGGDEEDAVDLVGNEVAGDIGETREEVSEINAE
jgi:hypothetical protein